VGGDAGQSAVLYDGEVCLGGAVIASASMTERRRSRPEPPGRPGGRDAQESGFRPEAPMYQPAHFVESRPEVLQRLIREHPFGLLVTDGASGLAANGVPFLLDPIPPAARACCAPTSPAPTRCGRRRAATAIRWSSSRAAGLHLAGLVSEQGRARQGRADLELHRRPGRGAVRFVDDAEWLRASSPG
jgi:hypothetical protein